MLQRFKSQQGKLIEFAFAPYTFISGGVYIFWIHLTGRHVKKIISKFPISNFSFKFPAPTSKNTGTNKKS